MKLRFYLKIIFCISFFAAPTSSRAQTYFYIQLQQIFNRIDEDIIRQPGQLQNITLLRLDSIPADSFIFPAHALKGLKLTVLSNDSVRMRDWGLRALRHGYSFDFLKKNISTSSALQYISVYEADSIHSIYLSTRDTLLSMELQRRFKFDQKLTKHINDDRPGLRRLIYSMQWYFNNRRNFKYITNQMHINGYPGDYYTTLTTDSLGFSAEGDFRAYYILLHYYSYSRKNITDDLYKEVIKGHLRPAQFGVIVDYLYRYGHRGNPTGEWMTIKKESLKTDAGKLREHLGLCTLEMQELKNELYRQRNKAGYELLKLVGFE